MKLFSKVSVYAYLLILLCLFHVIGNTIWIFLNDVPTSWDPSGHTLTSFKFYEYLIGENNTAFFRITDYYPPFVHLVATFFMMIFGISVKIPSLVTTGFFITAIIFLYLYTKELFKSRSVALLSAVIFSFLPKFYDLSREFLLDVPLIALSLACLYFLEKSQKFNNFKYVVAFSVTMGTALLTKWTASIFLFIPFLFTLRRGLNFKNLLLSGGIILGIVFPWYLSNAADLVRNAAINFTREESDPIPGWNTENITYYLKTLANFQLTWIGVLYFLFSISILFIYEKRKALMILLSVLFVYGVFTYIDNKDLRYILIIPILTTISISYFLVKLTKIQKFIGVFLSSVFILFLLMYYFGLSFGLLFDPVKVNYLRAFNLPVIGYIDYINLRKDTSVFLVQKYQKEIWPQEILLRDIDEFAKGGPVNILVLLEKERLNPENIKVSRKLISLENINVIAPYSMERFESEVELKKYLSDFSFILVSKNDYGPKGAIRYKGVLEQIREYVFESSDPNFSIYREYNLPDGDTLIIYQQKQNK